jgi:hypothetical protein
MNGAPAATPGQRAAGRSAPPQSSGGPSVKEALSTLESHAGESDDPTKAQAAIKTLRALVDASGPDAQDRKASTPGRQAAQRSGGDSFTSAASQAAQRFGGGRK